MVQASSMAQFDYISTSVDRTVYGNMAQLLTQRKGFSPLWYLMCHIRNFPYTTNYI